MTRSGRKSQPIRSAHNLASSMGVYLHEAISHELLHSDACVASREVSNAIANAETYPSLEGVWYYTTYVRQSPGTQSLPPWVTSGSELSTLRHNLVMPPFRVCRKGNTAEKSRATALPQRQ